MCSAINAQYALQQIRDVHKTQIHNVFATNTQCAQDTNTQCALDTNAQYVLQQMYTMCTTRCALCTSKCKFATMIVSTNRYKIVLLIFCSCTLTYILT